MTMKRFCLQIPVLLLALLVPLAAAQALPIWLPGSTVVGSAGPQSGPTTITAMMLDSNSASTTVSPDGNTVTFMNGSMTMAGMWMWSWNSIILDRDPLVSFAGGFQNISGGPQDFVFSITTPISPALASTKYGGQTIVTLIDPGLSGAPLHLTIDSSSNPAYQGQIDGSGVLNMLAALNLTTSGSSAFETQGQPGPSIPGGAANSTIGILHRFNLTAGDQATFNSSFEVIPEPGTFALLATGLGGLALHRRRRQA
jgi:hypothetical protein